MQQRNRLIPSPALGVALLALVLAMSGAAMALPGKASVKKDDLAKGAVTTKAIAKNAVKSKHLKNGAVVGTKVKDGSLSSADVGDESLTSRDVGDYAVASTATGGVVRLTATDGATAAAARAAAPATVLFAKGGITLNAKCFRDTGTDSTFAEVTVATAADGAIFDSSEDDLNGGPAATDFLNTTTPETDRLVEGIAQGALSAGLDEGEFSIIGADGTHLIGQASVAAKTGALAGGNGVYGPGNVCLFDAQLSG